MLSLTNWTVADKSAIARPDKTALGTKRRFIKKMVFFSTRFDILLIRDRSIRSKSARLQAIQLEKSPPPSTSTLGKPATQLCHRP